MKNVPVALMLAVAVACTPRGGGEMIQPLPFPAAPSTAVLPDASPAAPVPAPGAVQSSVPVAPPLDGPRLRIVATNDFHGALEPRLDNAGKRRGGAAAVAGTIAAAVAECPPPDCVAILLDGGDMFQGTPASNFGFGRPVLEIYNAVGYAAAALGNHEFDWGQDTLRMLMAGARHAILGANVREADGSDPRWIRNDTIVVRGPWNVGVIGISTVHTPVTTRAVNVANLRFLDPAPIVDSISRALRSRGAHAIVVIAHAGATCNAAGECQGEILDFAHRLTAPVDAIVAGHTHARVSTVVAGIPVVEARSRGQAVAVLDIPLGAAGDRRPFRDIREVYTDSVAAAPLVTAIVDRAVARVAPRVGAQVAEIAEPLLIEGRQHALGNVIADAMRVVGRGDVAVMNNGGIRQGLRAGPATYGALFEIQPFANVLYRVRIRGRDLHNYFQRALVRGPPDFHVSGATIHFSQRPTPAIDSVLVGGRRIDDATVYTLVVNDFVLAGGDRLGFEGLTVTSEAADLVDLDALVAYLRNLAQPVRAPTGNRIVIRP